MTTTADQRAFERVPAGNKVKIMGRGRLALYAIAVNLSLGGILLNATPSLPVGSHCAITIFDGGDQALLTLGTVVRSDVQGTAIQFSSVLAADNLRSLLSGERHFGLLDAYRSYFQVGRNEDNAGCERLLGVSRKTFQRVFYATFSASLPAAILPVWLAREAIQPFPAWEKIAACFLYGALWYFLLQPSLDLAVLSFLRKRRTAA